MVAAALAAACGDSTGSGGTGASGGGGAGGGAQGGEGQTGGGGGGYDVLCGGIAGIECGPTQYCDYPDDACGANDGDGVCAPITEGDCPAVDDPVCGCDGTVYGNACLANAAGVDVAADGCTPPPDTFQCGTGFCETATELCTVTGNDTASPPPFFYSCGALPAACAGVPASCDCAADTATGCGGTCEEVDGGVIIHCPGG